MSKYSFVHWYQPIYDLGREKIDGYEALIRCLFPDTRTPNELLRQAEMDGTLIELDKHSIELALSQEIHHSTGNLFVNILPSTMIQDDFMDWWGRQRFSSQSITLEISERMEIKDWGKIKNRISYLKERGVKIAIDDFGIGHSSFRHWIDLAPDFIKIDCYYFKNFFENTKKQEVVQKLVSLFKGSAKVIAEGIEREEDRTCG